MGFDSGQVKKPPAYVTYRVKGLGFTLVPGSTE